MMDGPPKSLGFEGVPGFPDTLFGTNDKNYHDRLSRDAVRLRGQNLLYFKKLDVPARIDGDRPLSDNPDRGDFDIKKRSGNASLYGEPVIIGSRLDAVTREITPAWNYSDPIALRGVVFRPQQNDVADDKGHIQTLKITLNLSRSMTDEIKLVPQIGDVVQLPRTLDDLYDVEGISRDEHRFGGTGFFTAYTLNLTRISKFLPQRKNLPQIKD